MSTSSSEQMNGETLVVIPNPSPWSAENSAEQYKIGNWGKPYFTCNSFGNISVRPHGDDTQDRQEIDLFKVVNVASMSDLHLPLIIRFPEILKHRVRSLQSSFDSAIKAQGYGSRYQGVYPVKCNQDRFIVDHIVTFRFGLEAGTKPELLLAMDCLSKGSNSDSAFLICNGFKDPEYIKLALIARTLKLKAIIVLELESEVDLIINLSRELGIRPMIGIRAKLLTKNVGHFWKTSLKFGLSAPEIDRVVEKLRSAEMLDCLQLLHFHISSQIQNTEILTECVTEGAQIYSMLVEKGAAMAIIDVGGGLGIDYDGTSRSDSEMSVNYTMEKYADVVVEAVRTVCDEMSVEHPVICSESGRAIVSHHSILVFEAFSATAQENAAAGESKVTLDESISWSPNTTYHVNLSIFTSIPDFWGIGHLFPIMPIHRLHEEPNIPGILSDITCDSDGLMTKFIGEKNSLMLHELSGSERYYLGMFLGGAYQEALGGHHNLFGSPNVVRVMQSDDAAQGFNLVDHTRGDSCGDILRVMQHDPLLMHDTLLSRARTNECDEAVLNTLSIAFDNTPYLDMFNKS